MSDRETMRAGMSAIWLKSLPHVRTQLDTIENVVMELQQGKTDDVRLRDAEREAHRLSGSAGTFGFHSASAAAHELEHLLQAPPVDAQRARDLLAIMRKALDTTELPNDRET